jgi:hypothetical protein
MWAPPLRGWFMMIADGLKHQNDERQRESWRPTRLQAVFAIVVAAAVVIAALATVMQVRSSLNEWTCKVNWSAPCANGAPLDLSPPKPGAK